MTLPSHDSVEVRFSHPSSLNPQLPNHQPAFGTPGTSLGRLWDGSKIIIINKDGPWDGGTAKTPQVPPPSPRQPWSPALPAAPKSDEGGSPPSNFCVSAFQLFSFSLVTPPPAQGSEFKVQGSTFRTTPPTRPHFGVSRTKADQSGPKRTKADQMRPNASNFPLAFPPSISAFHRFSVCLRKVYGRCRKQPEGAGRCAPCSLLPSPFSFLLPGILP
jgi:hypothetical protein